MRQDSGRSRALIGLLLLASVTIITLDSGHDNGGTPVDPLRSAVGAVLGPVESGTSTALGPVFAIPDHFHAVSGLEARNTALEAANARLRTKLRAQQADAARSAEVDSIAHFASTRGFDIVQAQVIAMGPAQSFSRTVTIDVGTDRGVLPGLTVINDDGLVGRVIAAGATTATVLLIVDGDSTVGGRLSGSMELGFLDGSGDVGGGGSLALTLVDHSVTPHPGDTVLSWGSPGGTPYLPGIPIGRVTSVSASPVELTETATVQPYVDFSALDIVGVITGRGRSSTALASGGTR